MTRQLSSEHVWQEIEKELFAVKSSSRMASVSP